MRAPLHAGELLQVLRAGAAGRPQSGPQRAPPQGRLRLSHPRAGPNELAPSWSRPASPRLETTPWHRCALNGLRISGSVGRRYRRLDFERGHRTLKILRKGGKHGAIRWGRAPPGLSTSTSASGRPGRSFSAPRAGAWTATQPTERSSAWHGERGSPSGLVPTGSALLHHRRPRRRGRPSGCPGGGQPRRSADDHAL